MNYETWKQSLGSLLDKEVFKFPMYQVWLINNGYEDKVQWVKGSAPWEIEPDENGIYN